LDTINERKIQADIRRIKGLRPVTDKLCVGAGRAHECLMAEHQRQLALVRRECGFRYLRFHGLLHDDMGVFHLDAEGKPFYNWQYIDLLFDYMLSVQVRPFVELGFMPSALASGPETIFWWKGNVTPPKSPEQWQDFIEALTRHWLDRYGEAEVQQWYFEVWNEPNLSGFFHGTQDQYFDLYDLSARAIKAVCPRFRVGGPATAGADWVDVFLKHCADKSVPVDFVSTHTYGVDGFLDEFGVQQTQLLPTPDSIVADVKKVHDQVAASAFPGLEIHFTEWSTSYSPADPVHDSYHSAAWILSKIKRCESLVSSMSYWTFTDIFEEPGPPKKHFHGGFGLLNVQGLRKPSFFAYKYMNRLGPTELENADANSWVCTDGSGVQALLWNMTPSGASESNQKYYVKDLPSAPAEQAELAVAGLRAGQYSARIFRVGYRKNDVYTAFLGFKVNGSLTPIQVDQLHAVTRDDPSETLSVSVGADGLAKVAITLDQNEVALVLMTPAS
jgi:xylan 1,4-beta-xylosidase